MIIHIEIPDEYLERRLLLLGGTELIASKEPTESFWKVKETRCNQCGECCMVLKPGSTQTPFGVDEEGKCKGLIKAGDKWECGAGFMRPYSCLPDPTDVESCCITHIKQEVK